MKNNDWKILRSEQGEDHKIFKTRFDYLINPRNGKEVRVTVCEGMDSVNVVAITKDNQVVIIDQYRFGINARTLELPGGLIDAGENPETAAQRELREETGYTGGEWTFLGKIPANPVFQDGYIYHFLAKNVARTHPTEMDDAEDIEVQLMPLTAVKAGLKTVRFQHPHTVSALVLGLD